MDTSKPIEVQIIQHLERKAGFDTWWRKIDWATQTEILAELKLLTEIEYGKKLLKQTLTER